MGRSFDTGRSEASSAVEASSTLQASLREHSKIRSKRTRSYAARAKFRCERVRAYLNLQVRLHRSSNMLEHTRSETLAMKLQWCGVVICIGMAWLHGVCIVAVYVYKYTWCAASHLVCSAAVPGANFGRGLCGACAPAVGAIAQVLVAVCSVCAGVICVDVIKRCIAVCTYAWVRCRYGV